MDPASTTFLQHQRHLFIDNWWQLGPQKEVSLWRFGGSLAFCRCSFWMFLIVPATEHCGIVASFRTWQCFHSPSSDSPNISAWGPGDVSVPWISLEFRFFCGFLWIPVHYSFLLLAEVSECRILGQLTWEAQGRTRRIARWKLCSEAGLG